MSKKTKNIDHFTHLELFEALIYDENVQDNLSVSNDYEPDKYGNNIITMGFEGTANNSKRTQTNAMILFTFNKEGRMISMEIAVRERGQRKWQIATSDKFIDMKSRFELPSTDRTN